MEKYDEISLCYVGNIPPFYHAKHLRMFFSTYVEMKAFQMFHFRHRPERLSRGLLNVSSSSVTCNHKSNCTFIKVYRKYIAKVIAAYNNRHWLHRNGYDSLRAKCFMIEISSIKESTLVCERAYLKRKELDRLRKITGTRISASTQSNVSGLLEFTPPVDMPNGNVGTPTAHFLALIEQCRLSSVVIAKLGLSFPRMRRTGKYSAVPHNYDEGGNVAFEVMEEEDEEEGAILAASGAPLLDDKGFEEYCSDLKEQEKREDEKFRLQRAEQGVTSCEEEKGEEDEDDDDTEEWDRFEALHDDPHNVDRGKLKVYEEEQEVVWEKGGPGLVFYTDEQVWRAQDKLEIFDDPTNYDWDLDMAVWYERGAGDSDAKQLLEIRRDKRWEAGIEDPVEAEKFFDRHRDTVGVQLLRKMGWEAGKRLGKEERQGLVTALENEGQKPSDKTGLGYLGPKLVRRQLAVPVLPPTPPSSVSTAPPLESLARRNDPRDVLKYRPRIHFVPGGVLKPK